MFDKNRAERNTDPLVDEFDMDDTRRIETGPDGMHGAPPEKAALELEERDFRPIRRSRTGKTGILGGLMYATFVICVSIVLACIGWMAARDVLALNKDFTSATVYLPDEIFTEEEREVKDDDGKVTGTRTVRVADIDYVADVLKDAGIIEYKTLFKLFAGISHADVKLDPGTYELSSELDYRALVKNMQVGTASMVVTKVTFPEGYTMDQIFQKLEDEEVCSKEDLYTAAAEFNYNFRFLENVETGDSLRLEGFIFPNTYDFYHGEQASSVINKFLSALHSRITADMWTQIENRGTTFREVVTVASMIEKEAANDAERGKIASVIYNRLNAGMELGIDSTVLYLFPNYDGGVQLPDNILWYDSPYNTRIYHGLPPTPICNPGMASINAALKPDVTNYLYYALDAESGEHQFFTNYNDFAAFVATQEYE